MIFEEDDHLQQWKRRATAALGYGTMDGPFRTNAESNFPFDAFKHDKDGDLPIRSRADFDRIIDSAPSLRDFIDAAAELCIQERSAGYCKGRMTTRQHDHPYANYPSLEDSLQNVLARHPYRRALTHEEYAQSNGKGWEPANKDFFMKW